MTRVNRVDLGDIGRLAEGCQGGPECLLGDAAAGLILLLVTGLATAVVVLTLVNLRNAAGAIREERERTAAERDAYAAFARRIAALDPPSPSSGPVARRDGGTVLARNHDTAPSPVPAVESAYRATVMDVSHYDEEYGEPFATHLAAEFGADVARAVRETDRLTPQLQSALVSNARTARDLRDDLVGTIDDEADAVGEARRTLEGVDRRLVSMAERPIPDHSYDELLEAWRRLDDLEGECDDLMRSRQAAIHADSFAHRPGEDAPDTLQAYLYEPLSVTYPVLADGSRVLDRIRTAKRRVSAALAAGPGVGTGQS